MTHAHAHIPERTADETFEGYRERRNLDRIAARKIAGIGLSNKGPSLREEFRDTLRRNGDMGKRTRAYQALMAGWASKRVTKAPLQDDHGAVTLIGSPVELVGIEPSSREFVIEAGSDHGERFYTVRRIWLAGISAQRGF